MNHGFNVIVNSFYNLETLSYCASQIWTLLQKKLSKEAL